MVVENCSSWMKKKLIKRNQKIPNTDMQAVANFITAATSVDLVNLSLW